MFYPGVAAAVQRISNVTSTLLQARSTPVAAGSTCTAVDVAGHRVTPNTLRRGALMANASARAYPYTPATGFTPGLRSTMAELAAAPQ